MIRRPEPLSSSYWNWVITAVLDNPFLALMNGLPFKETNVAVGRAITFGKYRGKSVPDIIQKDPQYLLWADDNVPSFSLTESERQQCEAAPKSQRANHPARSGSYPERVTVARDDLRSDDDMEEIEDYYWRRR